MDEHARSAFSALDRPEILNFVFYPRDSFNPAPSGAYDYSVEVDDNVVVSCRLYVQASDAPTVLYFHGNGEVVCDYDDIAPMYREVGLNLFVADYRGYGASQGSPTLSNTVEDAPVIFRSLWDILRREGYRGDVLVMGRSLGSLSAVEVAYRHQDMVKGLVIESGFAAFASLLSHLGIAAGSFGISDPEFPNLARIRSIEVPTLVIHGELDGIIPASEGEMLYRGSAARDKRLLVIPGADHNDIMLVGREAYFRAFSEFTST